METTLPTRSPENRSLNSDASRESGRPEGYYSPRFDIVETAHELTLLGDLPGVRSEDLEIRFENRELVIHGKVAPRVTAENRPIAREYGVGDFYRAFSVSEDVDGQRIHAELKNGVLTVHLPKAEATKPRRIQVSAG